MFFEGFRGWMDVRQLMSSILINSTAKVVKMPKSIKKDEVEPNHQNPESPEGAEKNEEQTEEAREDRKATGRSIAIIIFLSLMCLALYHVVQRKTTVLAGVSFNQQPL